ncbi:MAG: DUF488 domain-containing protein [Pseudomonadota bacterium]
MSAGSRIILSIGHSNHSPEFFLDLLHANRVEVLVDVRSRPYSRLAPWFSKADLAKNCSGQGIEYLFLGRELGGLRSEPELLDGSGRVDYHKVRNLPSFQKGLGILVNAAGQKNTAVMCAEEDPRRCHRTALLGPALRPKGFDLVHIRGDGRLENDDQSARAGGQGKLFDF